MRWDGRPFSVGADAPGRPLLPLRGNSPCAPGNDIIQFYSVAISALSAAALRRLRSETRLRAQFWRRNSLQEGFFDKLRRAGPVGPALLSLLCCQQFYVTPVCWERKTLIRYFYNKPSSFILYS